MFKFDIKRDHNWQHHVSYDSVSQYNCSAECCGGICRCGTIHNITVDPLGPNEFDSIASQMTGGKLSDFDQYLATRFLRWTLKPEMFEGESCSGWYGEEVGSIHFDTDCSDFQEFANLVDNFNKLTNRLDRLRFVLSLEYKWMLPEVEAVKGWELVTLPLKRVHASETTSSRIDEKLAQEYARYFKNSPRCKVVGLAVPDGSGDYRLLDGFHRHAAWTGQVKPEYDFDKFVKHRTITVLIPKEK